MKQTLSFLSIFVSLFWGISTDANAQSEPPAGTPYISLKVVNGAQIAIDMEAPTDNTTVWIETAEGNYTQETIFSYTGMAPFSFQAMDTVMKIHGDIVFFACGMNGENVTGIDISHNQMLTELIMIDNAIEGFVDFSTNPNLTKIDLDGNLFTSKDLDMMYCSLVEHPVSDSCRMSVLSTIEDTSSPAYATVITTNAANANDKNWRITSFDYGFYYSIENTTGEYICLEAVDEVNAADILHFYPNPVDKMLTIELTENTQAKWIEILDMTGKKVLSKRIINPITHLDVSSIVKGIYLIKIGQITEKLLVE